MNILELKRPVKLKKQIAGFKKQNAVIQYILNYFLLSPSLFSFILTPSFFYNVCNILIKNSYVCLTISKNNSNVLHNDTLQFYCNLHINFCSLFFPYKYHLNVISSENIFNCLIANLKRDFFVGKSWFLRDFSLPLEFIIESLSPLHLISLYILLPSDFSSP